MSDRVNVFQKYRELTSAPKQTGYSKVVIKVDDNTSYSAGDDTGATLYVDNPYGSQAAANSLLTQVRGYEYQPYQASGALVDIAAEIGDEVAIGQIYSGIYNRSTSYSRLSSADIGAPTDGEVEHEYPQARTNKYATYAGLKAGTTQVNGAGLIDGSVPGSAVENGGIGTSQLAENSVDNDILAPDSVDEGNVIGASLSTASFTSGVNTSLGYADYSNAVFNFNIYTVQYLYAMRGGFSTSFTLYGEGIEWKTRQVKNSAGQNITIRYLGSASDT